MLHLALPLALLAAPAAPAAPQGAVWVVDSSGGPGHDFTSIKAAVDAAVDGDTVLVRSGGYGPFPITGKSLSVVADAGATVNVGTFSGSTYGQEVSQLPSGTTTLVRGIRFHAPSLSPSTHTAYCMSLFDCLGTVWFEDCVFDGGTKAPIWIQNCGDVVLERCTATGSTGYSSSNGSKASSSAILASGVRLTVHGGVYTGGGGKNGGLTSGDPAPGLPGIHLQAGELYLAGCQVVGGPGGSGGISGCPSILPDGGPGLLADAGQVRVLGAALSGGAPGDPPFGCPPASQGPAFVLGGAVLTQLQGTPSSLLSNSPVREGQTLSLRLTTSTGTPLTALLLAGQATDPLFVAPLSGVGLLGGPTRRIDLGTVDPLTGIVTFQLTIPDLGPGVLAAPWIFQAYVCGSGGCTAGAATHTVWLDSSL